MKKEDEKILSYLEPIAYQFYTDTYFVGENKYLKECWLYSRLEKIANWVIKNGGTYELLTKKAIRKNDKKGYVVQIRFPSFGNRDMKNIMAEVYQ